jgi:hypothetical protein
VSAAETVIEAVEFRNSSQLLEELREVIAKPKYDRITVAELCGVLAMIQFETLRRWEDH